MRYIKVQMLSEKAKTGGRQFVCLLAFDVIRFYVIHLNLSSNFIDSEFAFKSKVCIDRGTDGVPCFQAVDLAKLILAHNNIESLREDLRNLPLLTVLNVSHNKLSELPAAIGE